MLNLATNLRLGVGVFSLLPRLALSAPLPPPHDTPPTLPHSGSTGQQYTTYNGIHVSLPVSRDLSRDNDDGLDAPLIATTLYYDRVHNATYEVQVPTAIAPPHMRLGKRKEMPGPLFGPGGVPIIEDIQQTTIPNCGWQSALGSIVHINSRWITDIASPEGGDIMSNLGNFGIHGQAAPFAPMPQKVDKTGLPDNRGDRSDVWWPSGFEGALAQIGLGPIMMPHISLSIVTGLPSRMLFSQTAQPQVRDAFDMNGLWDLVKRGEGSPGVLQSFNEAKTIAGTHAFSVIGGKEEGGRRIVTLYNPWGTTETIDLNALYTDVYAMHILEDYPSGPAGVPAPAPVPPAPAPPAPSADSQPQPQPQPEPARVDPIPQPAPMPTPAPVPDNAGSSSSGSGGEEAAVVWVTVTASEQDTVRGAGRSGRGRWNGWSNHADESRIAEQSPSAEVAAGTTGRADLINGQGADSAGSGEVRGTLSPDADLSDHPAYDYGAYADFAPSAQHGAGAGQGGSGVGNGSGQYQSGGSIDDMSNGSQNGAARGAGSGASGTNGPSGVGRWKGDSAASGGLDRYAHAGEAYTVGNVAEGGRDGGAKWVAAAA